MTANRVVVSEHRTRAAARMSRRRWKRRIVLARGGNMRASEQLRQQQITIHGSVHEEHGGRHTQQKWGVFFTPESESGTAVPGPPNPPKSQSHRPVG